MTEIKFYRVNEPWGEFSNFAPFPVLIGAFIWRTTEHYFQAAKFHDPEVKEMLRMIEAPGDVAEEGRKPTHNLRPDWENVKEEYMEKALRHKFMQHPELWKLLMGTGDALLIEHTENDSYWADGGDGSGRNRLGTLLMKVRDELRAYSDDPDFILPPWIAFPGTEMADMFWRMGWGESFIMEWAAHFDQTDQAAYRARFPEIRNWKGFYDDDPQIGGEWEDGESGSEETL
ncbi:NADAR family protein [Chitinophaga sp. NPDC101104]|uniref:NADAR family protein n=1 Tax=Chitinophaga sp. NPDC101104 TaxID=3390561 RepID=UPI003CFE5FF0